MCEGVVYLINGEAEREVMRDVLFVEVQGERLLLTDLFGNEKELSARIRNINFSQHRVIVEEP
jgi:predicted RNA-binding protein